MFTLTDTDSGADSNRIEFYCYVKNSVQWNDIDTDACTDSDKVENNSFSLLLYISITIGIGPSVAFYRLPATKLQEGNVFTSVCHEFCPQGGMHAPPPHAPPATHDPYPMHAPPPYYEMRSMSGQYASYWNASLLCIL